MGIKLVGIAAHAFVGVNMPIAAISLVQEIAALYLINTADGTVTSSDVNMYYGGAAFGAVISLANVAMAGKGGDDDEEVAEEYYVEDYGTEEPVAGDDSYGYDYYY